VTALAPHIRDPLEAGMAHHRAGNIAKAEVNYKRALAARPGDPNALHLLGLVAFDKGHPERALQLISKALARDPGNADYLHSAGHVLQTMERFDQAATRYHEALETDPDRVLTLSNLGNTLKRMELYDEAATELTRAVEIDPGFAEGWSNLGLVEKDRGNLDSAVACFEKAADLNPGVAAFPYNLGNVFTAQGLREKALRAYGEALAVEPAHGGARVNTGAALRQMGRQQEAVTMLDDALILRPGDAEARWNLGLTRLMAEDWQPGFDDFEARRQIPGMSASLPDDNEWDGRPIPGRRLLINHEQGLGDAIQFLRFASDAEKLGARVAYRGPEALLPLAQHMDGISTASSLDDPAPRFDLWVPMMSLPRVLKAVSPAKLGRSGYLRPDATRMTAWRSRLETVAGCRVGIGWQGNPSYGLDQERSVALKFFAPLAKLPGVSLISLQKGPGHDQLAGWPEKLPLLDLGTELDNAGGAFMDTAAALLVLDLVITSDSALAHLAGAVGVPTFLALPHVPDWRWGLEGTRTVWYPTVHVFRQRHPGDWDGVFKDMTEALGARIGIHG
jgi:Tfp pilus assembly protein PilF